MANEPPFISDQGRDLTDAVVRFAMDACRSAGVDPLPIMAAELRAMGWTVEEPDAS